MGSILNFIVGNTEYNGSDIISTHNSKPCFNPSVLFNEIDGKYSTTSNFEIKEGFKNLYYLECNHSLKDFFHKSKGTNKTILDTFPDNFINEIKYNNNVKILLTSLAEASELNDFYLNGIKEELNRHDIPFSKLLIFDSNINWKNVIEFKCFSSLHFLRTSPYRFYDLNELGYKSELIPISEINNLSKKFHFLSFNRNSQKFHRYFLILFLHANNLLDKTKLSALRSIEKIHNSKFDYLNKHLSDVNKKIPMELDTFNVDNKMSFRTSDTFDKQMYVDTFLHLVTETTYEEDNTLFFTEKITKPILGLQPFIVLSNPFYLKTLKEYGFKTFSSIIDESYDNEINNEKRLESIFSEITRISSLSISEINKLYKSVIDICIYNRNHLISLTKQNDIVENLKVIENEW